MGKKDTPEEASCCGNNHGHAHGRHGHGHSHAHFPAGDYLNRAFIIGITLNLAFVAVEFTAGLILGSMALISDAGHNLSDVVGLLLAMAAFRLAKLKPTEKYTYGRKNSTILVSLVNACILLAAIGVILYESILKLIEPQPVEGGAIAWIAGAGIVVNAFTAWLFVRHKNADLNVRGAYLHMAADALVSVGVMVSGIIIGFTGWYALDPAIGIVIAIVIFISTWRLLRDSVRLSLNGVPIGVDPGKTVRDIRSVDKRILDVHHVHIWALSTTENALTAHILVDSMDDSLQLKRAIKDRLKEDNIGHVTLEFEVSGEHRHENDCVCS